MSRTKRTRPSPSTWLILLLLIAVIILCIIMVFFIKESSTQKSEISVLEKKVADLTVPEGQDYLSYQKLYPEMKSKLPKVWNRSEKTVYLTFDDGPSKITPTILSTLKKENVKATFFVIGNGSDHSQMKKIADEGHVVAVHTYSHEYKKIYESVDSYVEDFHKIYKLIEEETGKAPTIFRYPGGSNNVYNVLNQPQTTAEMFRRGFVPFDWNVDSGDANAVSVPADQIASNSLKGIGSERVIILMHDAPAKATTAKALSKIIKGYKEAGYTFDVLSNEDAPILFSTPDGERYD